MRLKRLYSYVGLALLLAEGLLVLVSWMLSAAQVPGVRSLLATEGLRWYLGHFTEILLSPLLSWLLLVAMAAGCLKRSGLVRVFRRSDNYREKLAFRVVLSLLIIYIGIIALLVAVPHAVLLSATGRLWPSPFCHALVPLLSFGIILLSAVYGLITNGFSKVDDIFNSLIDGLASAAPLLLLYVLAIQFYESLGFIFH